MQQHGWISKKPYAKGKKPDTQEYSLYDYIIRKPRKVKINNRNRLVVARC